MSKPGTKRAIVIAGPTASGKSALAIELAERHGGVVVNADAMQVYADLAVLTARPTAADSARVPHRLFGHVDAAEAYSVGQWMRDMAEVLSELDSSARLPVIVGGTGLYLKALTSGLSNIPPIPPDVRARLRAEASSATAHALHARLTAVDPLMAERLRPSDPQRILRALEVVEATGRSLAVYQAEPGTALLDVEDIAGVIIDVPRPDLNIRIDRRFDAMLATGALDEVAALARRELDPTLPAMRALGVPQLISALAEARDLPAAVAGAKLASRQYAKRQVTYLRHQSHHLPWADATDASDVIARQLQSD